MSAGTGIQHSEYNHSSKDRVNFLQVWIVPDTQGYEPRYDQREFNSQLRNDWLPLISPEEKADTLRLNQKAYFSIARMDEAESLEYELHGEDQGAYLFVIEGRLAAADETLGLRDGLGIWETERFRLTARSEATILCIEVPMISS